MTSVRIGFVGTSGIKNVSNSEGRDISSTSNVSAEPLVSGASAR